MPVKRNDILCMLMVKIEGVHEMIVDAILDTLLDGIKLLPFLFITYLVMEYIEHKTSQNTIHIMKKSGKWGPVWGSALGLVPQCGFSAAASNLYAGRIITIGTLIAIFCLLQMKCCPFWYQSR